MVSVLNDVILLQVVGSMVRIERVVYAWRDL